MSINWMVLERGGGSYIGEGLDEKLTFIWLKTAEKELV